MSSTKATAYSTTYAATKALVVSLGEGIATYSDKAKTELSRFRNAIE